jgi:hypothetical protein
MMESFRESFKEQLLPAFRGSFATMFQQINSTLETGLRQQREEQSRVGESWQRSLPFSLTYLCSN